MINARPKRRQLIGLRSNHVGGNHSFSQSDDNSKTTIYGHVQTIGHTWRKRLFFAFKLFSPITGITNDWQKEFGDEGKDKLFWNTFDRETWACARLVGSCKVLTPLSFSWRENCTQFLKEIHLCTAALQWNLWNTVCGIPKNQYLLPKRTCYVIKSETSWHLLDTLVKC